MPDRDDFPRCSTCNYHTDDETAVAHAHGHIVCEHPAAWKQTPFDKYPDDFGCILHSDLETDE